jgi:NADH-quinone oxidoreductase subunit A
MTPTSIVAYLILFALVGFLFVFGALLLGWFLRGQVPTKQKLDIYECGEPAIGPGNVQFDLRFYVVALVFIIFEVEVAFFFPWATVFGKATQLMANHEVEVVAQTYRELGVRDPQLPDSSSDVKENARRLALAAMADIGVFFGVLLVGFAYVWNRGDLDWVRATGST